MEREGKETETSILSACHVPETVLMKTSGELRENNIVSLPFSCCSEETSVEKLPVWPRASAKMSPFDPKTLV